VGIAFGWTPALRPSPHCVATRSKFGATQVKLHNGVAAAVLLLVCLTPNRHATRPLQRQSVALLINAYTRPLPAGKVTLWSQTGSHTKKSAFGDRKHPPFQTAKKWSVQRQISF